MDDDIKKLNPSVNYNEKPIGKNNVSAFEKKMKEKYDKELKTFWANDRFYKYFSFLIIVIFTIVILNITYMAYITIKPAAFSPCRPVLSDEIIDVYSSVDDWDSAKSVLKRRMAGEYLFVESRIEACGHSGIFAYYFKGLDYNNQNTTYIVCDDETISRIEIVCREHSPIAKLFISIITVFN